MKRYAVVAWDNYYPCGDLDNIVAHFDHWNHAYTFANHLRSLKDADHVKVVDMQDFTPAPHFHYMKMMRELGLPVDE